MALRPKDLCALFTHDVKNILQANSEVGEILNAEMRSAKPQNPYEGMPPDNLVDTT
jgi:superfamily I DNA and RNA helicase